MFEGIAEQLYLHSTVKAEVDERYQELANDSPGQISASAKKPKNARHSATGTPGARGKAAKLADQVGRRTASVVGESATRPLMDHGFCQEVQ